VCGIEELNESLIVKEYSFRTHKEEIGRALFGGL
jgi:hypothetical protein